MTNVFVEPRPKGKPEGTVEDFVVEDQRLHHRDPRHHDRPAPLSCAQQAFHGQLPVRKRALLLRQRHHVVGRIAQREQHVAVSNHYWALHSRRMPSWPSSRWNAVIRCLRWSSMGSSNSVDQDIGGGKEGKFI